MQLDGEEMEHVGKRGGKGSGDESETTTRQGRASRRQSKRTISKSSRGFLLPPRASVLMVFSWAAQEAAQRAWQPHGLWASDGLHSDRLEIE